ncbi:MAG: ATP-dependent RecD-like DNA helicase, partial [Acholeplasmataceae bacterium]
MNTTIKGYIKSYIYKNEDNGYTIAKIETENKDDLTIVGYFPMLNEDTLYEFKGEMISHTKYGEQFKVLQFIQIEDISEKGLVSFLSSDEFTGIGPVTAQKIIDLLGIDAIDKIIENHLVLAPILNRKRSEALKEQLITNKKIHEIYITLFNYGISNRLAAKLYKEYEDLTIYKLEENPFRLMDEIYGFGFIKSLDVAIKMGFKKDDLITIK